MSKTQNNVIKQICNTQYFETHTLYLDNILYSIKRHQYKELKSKIFKSEHTQYRSYNLIVS